METIKLRLQNENNELNETLTLRKWVHQLELCRIIIEKHKRRTPASYHNLQEFYDLSSSLITYSIGILEKAINEQQFRSLVIDLTEKIKSEINSIFDWNKELAIDLENLRSEGLKKDHNMLEAFDYYLNVTPIEELEMKVKSDLPALKASSNSIIQIHNRLVNGRQ
jgi:hypothetical protein